MKLISICYIILVSAILWLFYMGFVDGLRPLQHSTKLNENSFKIGRNLLTVSVNEGQNFEFENCSRPAILDFPGDGFTREQRQQGWIIVHIALLIYGFLFLATVCDDYLVPSVEQICSSLNIDGNIVGAIVMAAAISGPELFMNFIGTFVTKADIGVSSIVGSAVFNVLVLPACCGLFAASCLHLDWWSTTRDCSMYLISILTLVSILSDGQVWWYEALFLILAYIGYMLIMKYQAQVSRRVKNYLLRCGYYRPCYSEVSEFSNLLHGKAGKLPKCSKTSDAYGTFEQGLSSSQPMLNLKPEENEEFVATPWSRGSQSTFEHLLRWPITLLLWLTVPNSRRYQSLKYLTLLLSTLWIAGISYLVAMLITIIGDTLNVPDAAMGLTVLAYGLGVPEAVSIIIATKQDRGCRAMSDSLRSNAFDILLCLGLPWFIKAFFFPQHPGQKLLYLGSTSLIYASIMLLASLLVLYLLLAWNKFVLNRRIGLVCLIIYISCMIIATLVELNVFFPINLPRCKY